MISINTDKCTGCRLCEKSCPHNAISISNKKAVINMNNCTICGLCVDTCAKEKAITITQVDLNSQEYFDRYKGLTVFIEQESGEINPVSYEILGEARRLADKYDLLVTALIITDKLATTTDHLFHSGADRIIYFKNKKYGIFRNESYTNAATYYIRNYSPAIVLAGATAIGRSFIPKVASEVKAGLTADCTKLEIQKENTLLLGTRPAFGGNLMATIVAKNSRPQFATVRHKIMKPITPDIKRSGTIEIIERDFSGKSDISEVLDIIKENSSEVCISEADVIVAGGHGVGSKENFKLIKDLAEILGGTFAASRSAVDLGWAPYSHQVGQTGKTVNPKLYIACGISGAIQHIAGMQSSDYIIAINSDPNAEIFSVANKAICGDLFEILPLLIKALKK